MILTIDNLDGLGPIDYTASVDCSEPFEVERTLNQPSVLKGMLCLVGSNLIPPVRRGRVVLASTTGTVIFTGYLTTEPASVYAGVASEGPVSRLALSAVSDEWLLDKQSWGSVVGPTLGASLTNLLLSLVQRMGGGALSTGGLGATRSLGYFETVKGAVWSRAVGAAASAAYTAYRAIGGSIGLGGIALNQHALTVGDGSLQIAGLKTTSLRELANDVTVTGAEEPYAYWTELFSGDGTTTVFNLLGEPAAPNGGHEVLIAEPFNESALNTVLWQVNDSGSHFALSGSGLSVMGGTGIDGQTTFAAWDQVELGGTLVLAMTGVQLSAGSAGVLGGLYNGVTEQANCFAGFNIRQSAGTTLATSMLNGVEVGTSITILAGHRYTLRLRLYCPELVRLKQQFYAVVDTTGGATVQQFGSGYNSAPISLVFEVRDEGVGSNTPATVLYDGADSTAPIKASLVAVNSVALTGSIGSLELTRTGTCWVRSTSATGDTWTRLIGKAAEGADCSVTSSVGGNVTFFNGRVPAVGETISVSYRGRKRAVARVADPASIATEAASGSVGTARWLGHLVQPVGRCDEDCENAAVAILSFATNRAAAMSGSYRAVNPPGTDIWPGDLLVLTTSGNTLNAMVRRVTVSQQGASPEELTYHIDFANDWAEGLGIKLSETIAEDALLPTVALDLVESLSGTSLPVHVLGNLQQITVAGPSSEALSVDAGLAPPTGGGFEVRRRDGGFGTGTAGDASCDLVLRSPVRGFSIPVSAVPESFFIRMYDGSSPPLYSRYSAAIVNQKPVSS